MHLNRGVPKRIFAGLLTLLCTGCAPGQSRAERQVQDMRALYQSMESISGSGTLCAQYPDRAYEFEVDLEGTQSAGCFTVTAPENLSGTVIRWAQDALMLEVEGISLETGALNPSGFSPADAFPAILKSCQQGTLLECCEEESSGKPILYAAFENPDSPESSVECRFDADSGALRQAQVLDAGKVIVTLTLKESQVTLSGEK